MITRENLDKLYSITAEIKHYQELASELLRTAQDRFGNRTHPVERLGKIAEVKESTLWDEVFHLGTQCEAAKILTKEHPEVFSAYATQDKLAAELKTFSVLELGVDSTKLTLADYLALTEELFTFLHGERHKEIKLKVIQEPSSAEGGVLNLKRK